MATRKSVNVDAMAVTEVEVYSPDDMPDYPIVNNCPTGWPTLACVDGRTWFERAQRYELDEGRKLLPLGYMYSENGDIVDDPDYKGKKVDNG